jgi:ketosteroid isomerase-like protein
MHDLAELESRLNQLLLAGRPMDAFERFYADDIVMQENVDAPFVGKELNRARELAFFGAIASFDRVELLGSAVGDGVTYSEWIYELTLRDGRRLNMTEVAARRWRDGLVVHERFYYDPHR